MSRVLVLPAAAWAPEPAGGQAAGFEVPAAGRLVVWAEGIAAEGTCLMPQDGVPWLFHQLGATAFASGPAIAGQRFRLIAPAVPARCLVLVLPEAGPSPTLDAFLPRAVACPAAHPPADPATARAWMEAALAAQDLDGALAAIGDMLLRARGMPETDAALAHLFAHLARHPLCRGAGLGALVAAITE